MISLKKLKILTPLQKLSKNVGDLGKLIVAQSAKNHQIWSHCFQMENVEWRAAAAAVSCVRS